MHFGLNHNVKYRGEIYHIQTEDGGKKNPVITTHLFKGGAVLTTRRTAYSDILNSERHDNAAIREMMRVQHLRVLKDLKEGLLDGRIEGRPAEDDRRGS